MRVIVDTHLFIYREYEKALPKSFQELLIIFHKLGIQIFAHPLSLREVEQDANIKNRQVILSKVKTYPVIDTPPDANADVEFMRTVGISDDLRDEIDNQLIYCIYKNAADFLITEDSEMHRVSQKLNLTDRVLGVSDAIELFSNRSEINERSSVHYAEPIFCFFNSGDYWKIGETSKKLSFKNLKGFEFIHFLLQYPDQQFSPEQVYNVGIKLPLDLEKKFVTDGRTDDEIIEKIRNMSKKELIDFIVQLKKGLKDSANEDPESETYFREILQLAQKSLNDLEGFGDAGLANNPRANVTKRIRYAIGKITDKIPSLRQYLNRDTIRTGNTMFYSPDQSNCPRWILFPSELPKNFNL